MQRLCSPVQNPFGFARDTNHFSVELDMASLERDEMVFFFFLVV